mgnify:CR=1 FL=1
MSETNLNELMHLIYNLKCEKENTEKIITDLKSKVADLDENIDCLSSTLLREMQSSEIKELRIEELVATVFRRENIGYKSDEEVLKYLKENYGGKYIKTKITESLDKTNLKKAIKTDATLSKALEDMTVTNVTEYVVVQDLINNEKMLEHIAANTGANK